VPRVFGSALHSYREGGVEVRTDPCPSCKSVDTDVLGVADDKPWDEALYLLRCGDCGHEFTVERSPSPSSANKQDGSPTNVDGGDSQ
jgi:hypothetical protein